MNVTYQQWFDASVRVASKQHQYDNCNPGNPCSNCQKLRMITQSMKNMRSSKVAGLTHYDDIHVPLNMISMTIMARFDTQFDIDNINKYLPLSDNGVFSVKNNKGTIREVKNGIMNEVQGKGVHRFYNQITLRVHDVDGVDRMGIPVKVFKTGTVHITALRSKDQFIRVMKKVCECLKQTVILDDTVSITNNIDIEKRFLDNEDNIDIEKMTNLKVVLFEWQP